MSIRLSDDEIYKVLKATDYLYDGSPLKDAMDEDEVEIIIMKLGNWLKECDYRLEDFE